MFWEGSDLHCLIPDICFDQIRRLRVSYYYHTISCFVSQGVTRVTLSNLYRVDWTYLHHFWRGVNTQSRSKNDFLDVCLFWGKRRTGDQRPITWPDQDRRIFRSILLSISISLMQSSSVYQQLQPVSDLFLDSTSLHRCAVILLANDLWLLTKEIVCYCPFFLWGFKQGRSGDLDLRFNREFLWVFHPPILNSPELSVEPKPEG